jgi:predicted GIY-YIG superfamily endonuclease
VYVVRRPSDNRFYCGQTDDLVARLKRHRQLSSAFAGGRGMEACYVRVPRTAVATAVEARTITVRWWCCNVVL